MSTWLQLIVTGFFGVMAAYVGRLDHRQRKLTRQLTPPPAAPGVADDPEAGAWNLPLELARIAVNVGRIDSKADRLDAKVDRIKSRLDRHLADHR